MLQWSAKVYEREPGYDVPPFTAVLARNARR
jgi:hypothetical protein